MMIAGGGRYMTPRDVEALLERYHVLDTVRGEAYVTIDPDVNPHPPPGFRAAEQRADLDAALVQLRQLDERLWLAVKHVHLIPYPDPRHPDYHRDRHWLAHVAGRLASPVTTRRQLAAHDLGLSYGTVWTRCRQAYRHLADLLRSP
jgi:hypothetical protein